jgi:hypothetical protein
MSQADEAKARLFRLLPGDDQHVPWKVAKLACEAAVFNAVAHEAIPYQLAITTPEYEYPEGVFEAI